jgi:hypothetical protein
MLTHKQARNLATLYGSAMRVRALDIAHIANNELCDYLRQFPRAAMGEIIKEFCALACSVGETSHNQNETEKG